MQRKTPERYLAAILADFDRKPPVGGVCGRSAFDDELRGAPATGIFRLNRSDPDWCSKCRSTPPF